MKYHQGNMFVVLPEDKTIAIPHVCNDVGGWGCGFVVPLAKHYPFAKEAYLQWHQQASLNSNDVPFELGQIQTTENDNCTVHVVNMIAQSGLIDATNPRPLKYNALVHCMERVAEYVSNHPIEEIHAPKFGSDLAGGNWKFIESLIEDIWVPLGLPITIYYL